MNNGSKNGHNGNNGNGNNNGSLFEFPENIIIPQEVDDFSSKDLSDQIFADLLIKNEPFETEGSSDASTGSFRRRPSRYEHPLWGLGWTDGRLGQPSETNETLLLARGRVRRFKKIQAMKAKLSLNEARLPDLQSQVTRVRELLVNATTHYTNIVNEQAARFHEFSFVLGVVYLVVAALLFLSDVPLTLTLVAKGFELKTEVKDPQTGVVMYGIDDPGRWPPGAIIELWEPFLLAFGIALAGVFIKIFLDDVIFRQTPDIQKKRKRALLVILLVFVGTILALGIFRSQIQHNLGQNKDRTERVEQEARLRESGLDDAAIAAMLGPPKVREKDWTELITFVALTLALPAVGAACFSAGWRRFKDAHRHRQLKKELKELEQALETASVPLHSTASEIESAKTWLQLNENQPDPDAETQQELSLYRHGYFRGVNVPETIDHGLTLYDRVQRSAQKILAKKLKERMWSDVEVRNP